MYKLSKNNLIKDNDKLSGLIEQTNKEFQNNLSNQRKKLLNTEHFFEITGVCKLKATSLNDNEKLLLSLLCCKLTREQISIMLNTTTESIRVRTIKLTQKLAEKGIDSCYKPEENT